MSTLIKCPNCGFEFPLEDALNDELKTSIEKEKQELRLQMLDYKKQKEEELRKKEEDYSKQQLLQESIFKQQLDEALKK